MIKKIFYLIFSFFLFISSANAKTDQPIPGFGALDLAKLIKEVDPHNSLKITPTPEVLAELTRFRTNEESRAFMHMALERMNKDKDFLLSELKGTDLPTGVLALSLVESGYQPLKENPGRLSAAGIWQLIPSTARYLGLVVESSRDDRMNTQLATAAALNYLNEMHKKFEDWKLAIIAYEYGESETRRLITSVGSRDPWTIARSPLAPKDMKKYLALFDASAVLMQKQELVAGS